VYSPLTWGIYDEPPPDVPECGFVGELCPPATQGKSSLSDEGISSYNFYTANI